jgi:hypothetical protein
MKRALGSVLVDMAALSLALGILLGTAHAAGWTGSQVGAPSATTINMGAATPLLELNRQQISWLKPVRKKLPQNPYAASAFSAYTLEWGEAKVGLASIAYGVLPGVELGTVPMLHALGIQNINGKLHLAQAGPVDLAITGAGYQLGLGDFTGTYTSLGARASLRLATPWSIHAGVNQVNMNMQGLPDLSELSPLLTSAGGDSLQGIDLSAVSQHVDLQVSARATTAELATDLRLNRRDSLILRGQAMIDNELTAGFAADIPPILGMDEALSMSKEETFSAPDTYVVSLAWQMAWKRWEARIGAGVSSVPGAWLLQSTELSYKLGGKTRWSEAKLRRGWRKNRRVAKHGFDT